MCVFFTFSALFAHDTFFWFCFYLLCQPHGWRTIVRAASIRARSFILTIGSGTDSSISLALNAATVRLQCAHSIHVRFIPFEPIAVVHSLTRPSVRRACLSCTNLIFHTGRAEMAVGAHESNGVRPNSKLDDIARLRLSQTVPCLYRAAPTQLAAIDRATFGGVSAKSLAFMLPATVAESRATTGPCLRAATCTPIARKR